MTPGGTHKATATIRITCEGSGSNFTVINDAMTDAMEREVEIQLRKLNDLRKLWNWQAMLNKHGRMRHSRNSKCRCGSGQKTKRCCGSFEYKEGGDG